MDRETKLDRLIADRGLSQKGLAELLGVDPARLSEWKRGRWRMPVETGVLLARALGVTAEYLVDETQERLPPPGGAGQAETRGAAGGQVAPQLDEDTRYLLRVIADSGLTPADVARQLLQAVKEASSRPLYRPVDLEILDLPATAPTPNASAPAARLPGTPRTA